MINIIRKNVMRNFLITIYGKPLGEKIKLMWKASWLDQPAYMISAVLAIPMFIGSLCFIKYLETKQSIDNRKYHYALIICRPDDPRLKTLKMESRLDD